MDYAQKKNSRYRVVVEDINDMLEFDDFEKAQSYCDDINERYSYSATGVHRLPFPRVHRAKMFKQVGEHWEEVLF